MINYSDIDNRIARLVVNKNDNPELILRKKFFLLANLTVIVFFSLVALTAFYLDARQFAGYVSLILAFAVAQILFLLIWRNWSKWFVYTIFSLHMMLIFYIIIRLGGLANSAGLLMVAYFFLLTARADSDSRITGLHCGADAYLTKPFDKKELLACLHNLLVQREKLRVKYQARLYGKIPEEHGDASNARFLNKMLSILEKTTGMKSSASRISARCWASAAYNCTAN